VQKVTFITYASFCFLQHQHALIGNCVLNVEVIQHLLLKTFAFPLVADFTKAPEALLWRICFNRKLYFLKRLTLRRREPSGQIFDVVQLCGCNFWYVSISPFLNSLQQQGEVVLCQIIFYVIW